MKKNSIGFLTILMLTIIFSPLYSFSSSVFEYGAGTEVDTVGYAGPGSDLASSPPQISIVGGKIYMVWEDESPGIGTIRFLTDTIPVTNLLDPSTNQCSGDAGGPGSGCIIEFANDILLALTNGDVSTDPQIAVVSDSEIYVSWIHQDAATGDYFLGVSKITDPTSDENEFTNLGVTTPAEFAYIPLDSPGDKPISYHLAANADNAYIVWEDGPALNEKIGFAHLDSSAGPFSIANQEFFHTVAQDVSSPKIALSSSGIFLTWQDNESITSDIMFTSDTGAGFGPASSISGASSDLSLSPEIAANDADVFVSWVEGDPAKIFYSKSDDAGVSFNVPSAVSINTGSSEQQMVADSSGEVYLVWQEPIDGTSLNDIFFRATNGGTFTEDPINLSKSSDQSLNPKISLDGSMINVVWQDRTFDPNGEVWLKSSSNSGTSFGGLQIISENSASYNFPLSNIASSPTFVGVTWRAQGGSDVFFKPATVETFDLSFDKTEYESDIATITLSDSTLSGTQTISLNGAPVDLPEISLGVFSSTVSLSDFGGFPGQLFEATFGTPTFSAFAKIPTSNSVSFNPGDSPLNDGKIYGITVIDSSASGTVDVNISSPTNTAGVTVTLPETGAGTGIFSGTANIGFASTSFTPAAGDIVTITQVDTSGGTGGVDTKLRHISSTTNPVGINFDMTETSATSDTYTRDVTFCNSPCVSDGTTATLEVESGDFITFSKIDGTAAQSGIILPDTIPDRALLDVTCDGALCGTATLTYDNGVSPIITKTVNLQDVIGSGGGGGGISRAGFVVNIVAGLGGSVGGGSSGGNSPPLIPGTSSFAIISGGDEGFGGILGEISPNTFDQTKTFKVGEKAVLRFDFIEGGGIGKIEHIGLYTNVRDGQKRQDSNAYIYFNPLKSPQVTVHDPNKLFSKANFELLPTDTAADFVLKFELTFAKPMAKSDFILESWNLQKWSTLKKFSNAIEVIPSEIVETSASESKPISDTFLEDITNDKVVPIWVKTNAKWWADGSIDNKNFISGIEYLVNEGIIVVSLPDNVNPTVSELQPWIKNTAGWWADDMISEDEFISAIEWLILNDIIRMA